MSLFDGEPLTRTDASYKRHDETTFEFLNRAANEEFAAVRRTLNLWFEGWPAEDSGGLRGRFRSKDHVGFLSAFWELYLHEGFRRLGWSVSVEPADRTTGKRPDLLVQAEREQIVIEACVVGEARAQQARNRRLSRVFDSINEIRNYDFFIQLEIIVEGREAPPSARLRDDLSDWLRTLNREELKALLDDGRWRDLPSRRFSSGNWVFRARAIPVSDEAARRADPAHRVIGIYPGGGGWSDPNQLRDSLTKKRPSRYSTEGETHIIAVLDAHPLLGEDSLMDALFGDQVLQVELDGEHRASATAIRRQNAFWTPSQNTRVSGVLYARELMPWSVAAKPATLWVNPWTSSRPPDELTWIRYAEIGETGEVMYREPAVSPREHFGL